MKKAGSWILLTVCGIVVSSHSATIMHKFVAIDEGRSNLLYVNEADSTKNWTVPISQNTPRDLQLIGSNRVLVGHADGYLEVDLATGKILKTVTGFSGATSARRLENGHTLLTGVNLAKSTGVVVAEVDSLNAVVGKIVYPGSYSRLMRQTAKGTYLIASDTMIQEGDKTGTFFWKAPVAGFSHMWKAVRLPTGNTLISAGYGAFMVEIDPSGAIVRKFGDKTAVPTAVHPYFYAMFQLLNNGDVVVANWQGHGDGHGASGIQLLEFDKTGAIVWQWSRADMISSLQGILVIDSLNTSLLYDERNGIMEPIGTVANLVQSKSLPENSCSFRLVQAARSISIMPLFANVYTAAIYDLAGRCAQTFRGTGNAVLAVSKSGTYLIKCSDGINTLTRKLAYVK
jgi:hypothetical protein